jgi:glycosyltransferase involved in cell wall biosynthesis
MDAFALTSREDPFPLVMLEAGMHGLPTVCFESSGGGPEFIGEDAGCAVPYLDLEHFSAALRSLQEAPELRHRMGDSARLKVEREYSVAYQGPKLVRCIERCFGAARQG